MDKLTTFFDIRTDFGFKKIFGSEKNKHLLVRFLNALFGDVITIKDVEFHNKEILSAEENGKRIVYDIYCTSKVHSATNDYRLHKNKSITSFDEGLDHHFILEMQNQYEPPFEERVLYYTAKAIAEQGSKGWDYSLEPVVSVVLTSFDFKNMKDSLVHEMVFSDRVTGDILTDKMRIVLLSLKQLKGKRWDECENELEQILYLVRNMENLNKESEAYKSGDFKEYFEAAETASMVNEDVVAYSQSLQKLRSIEAGVRYARQEAKEEEMIHSIRLMDSFGITHDKIAKAYNLSLEEIGKILKE